MCPETCELIKFNKLRSYHLSITKLDLRNKSDYKKAKKILNDLMPKIRQITQNRALKIKFGSIVTFPKKKNLKVWFIKPEFTADF